VKSIAAGGLRALLSNIWKAIRSPGKAIGELWAAIKLFGTETLEALRGLWASIVRLRGVWQRSGSFWEVLVQAFRTGRWEGPLGWITRLLKGSPDWSTVQQAREASYLFKSRLFGQTLFYDAEHLATQSGALTSAAQAWRNGYWNTFLKLPLGLNRSLQNRALPRAIFYGAVVFGALLKSAFLGWAVGRAIVSHFTEPPPAPAGGR
jgi:hypothetical protein